MSAPSFTPGPWKAHTIKTDYGLPYTPVSAKTLLARVYSEAFGDHEESEANARLIAAAPDLLEALESYVTTMAIAGGGDKALFMAAIRDADNKARAAIKKATGE